MRSRAGPCGLPCPDRTVTDARSDAKNDTVSNPANAVVYASGRLVSSYTVEIARAERWQFSVATHGWPLAREDLHSRQKHEGIIQ